jgi:hypothetical protein
VALLPLLLLLLLLLVAVAVEVEVEEELHTESHRSAPLRVACMTRAAASTVAVSEYPTAPAYCKRT